MPNLVLSMRPGESVTIDGACVITYIQPKGRIAASLGFEAPLTTTILRTTVAPRNPDGSWKAGR